MMKRAILRSCIVAGLMAMSGRQPQARSEEVGDVCSNSELMRSIRIIDAACHDLSGCDFESLGELERLEKSKLIEAWAHPDVAAVHVFFPTNVFDITQAYDWASIRDQLESLKYMTSIRDATLYVIGQASRTGSFDQNVALSRKRMQSVSLFIRDVLKVECRDVRGGYLGARFVQLATNDAKGFRLHPAAYRGDELVLNQAVHVFLVPCEIR